MTCLSAVDSTTRLEVTELLSRFCRYADRGQSREWAALFTTDGRFVGDDGFCLQGAEQLATLPDLVAAKGGVHIRHLLTAVTMDLGSNHRELIVEAYGPVLDLAHGGGITRFYDLRFELRRLPSSWRIAEVISTEVGRPGMTATPIDAEAGQVRLQ